jgi:hypothetical protein
VSETVGELAALVVDFLLALVFAGGMVYYTLFQSTKIVNKVSILSMEHLSGMMPNASLTLQDGQKESLTEWTCKMTNPYPMTETSSIVNIDASAGWVGMFKDNWTPLLAKHLPVEQIVTKGHKGHKLCSALGKDPSACNIGSQPCPEVQGIQTQTSGLIVICSDGRTISQTRKKTCAQKCSTKNSTVIGGVVNLALLGTPGDLTVSHTILRHFLILEGALPTEIAN